MSTRQSKATFDVIGLGAVNIDYVVPPRTTAHMAVLQAVEPDRERIFADEAELKSAVKRARKDPDTELRLGGSALNAMHILGRMQTGLKLGFVGIEGTSPDDLNSAVGTYGWPAKDLLEDAGVNTAQLWSDSRNAAGVCVAGRDSEGRRLRTWPGANSRMAERLREPAQVTALRKYLMRASIVHVTSFLDEDTPGLLADLLGRVKAKRPTLRISFDPGHTWVCEPPEGFDQLLRMADFLFLNQREMFTLAGDHDGEDSVSAARQVLERSSRNSAVVVLKLKEGATLFQMASRGGVEEYRAHRVPLLAKDDVGAGDAFAAAFLAGYVKTRYVTLVQSAHLAARVAAARVRHSTAAWHEDVADVTKQFFEQLPPPTREQPANIRHTLRHGDTEETLDLLCELAPRFYDAACHLRAITGYVQAPGVRVRDDAETSAHGDGRAAWREDELQALIHALLTSLFRDVDRENPGGRYAGRWHRVDIMLRSYGIGIEIELTSRRKRDSAVGTELRRHIDDYRSDPNVRAVFGLIFDPGGHLENPALRGCSGVKFTRCGRFVRVGV